MKISHRVGLVMMLGLSLLVVGTPLVLRAWGLREPRREGRQSLLQRDQCLLR
ncbi:MAG: hypothetical protein HY268_23695 [Deltaproteobacteria bacterium]|nr:hypothetical protein [Deltaproteobacteria bacterium]